MARSKNKRPHHCPSSTGLCGLSMQSKGIGGEHVATAPLQDPMFLSSHRSFFHASSDINIAVRKIHRIRDVIPRNKYTEYGSFLVDQEVDACFSGSEDLTVHATFARIAVNEPTPTSNVDNHKILFALGVDDIEKQNLKVLNLHESDERGLRKKIVATDANGSNEILAHLIKYTDSCVLYPLMVLCIKYGCQGLNVGEGETTSVHENTGCKNFHCRGAEGRKHRD